MQTQGKVDAKKLKSQLSLAHYEQILKAIGIPIFSQSPKEWRMWTGEKNKNPYDGSVKLFFYPDSRVFMSYTSGCSMDIIELVKRRLTLTTGRQISFIEAVNEILSITGLDPNAISRINAKKNVYDWESDLSRFIRFKRQGSALKVFDESILDQLDTAYYQGWIDEGISIQSMEKFGIKWYPRTSQIVIPCRDEDGQLIGIRCRNLDPERIKSEGKYHPLFLLNGMSYQFPTNNVLYGLSHNRFEIERTGSVTIVEGEKSVLLADSVLGEKSNVVALFGSNLGNKRLKDLLKLGVNNVTLALDSDFHEIGDAEYDKFEAKVFNMARLFKGYCSVSVCYNNIGLGEEAYKASPFDLGKDNFEKMWVNREEVDFKKNKK